LQVVAMR